MSSTIFSLADAGNTFNPALLILRSKGYRLRLENFDDYNIWHASKKDEARFSAGNPLALLALTVIWENFGEDWNRQDPSVLEELCENDDA